ncbi:ATP-binding cassette domain-containing protein [Actinoplanes sp. N902-109]|uniref:ATP-binding cassette domain-containing protein n=1 Tax=Actinoplanes sp. (strain N902-109) TaxID=649831 RepID=UPI0003293EAF|nr:ATP-binding cassette domain-containing protein [Actinoplanes sp. N902-109]AGL16014.1 ABC transporter [Actinoplanes sp. N902-109]
MSAVIDVRHLVKRLGDHAAVDDVSFSVAESEIFGLLGPAGAGKTTILECLTGLRSRDAGDIEVLGADPRLDRADVTRRLAGWLTGAEAPNAQQLAETLTLYNSFYRDPAAWRRLADTAGVVGEHITANLSLAGIPQVVVFDDVTAGLGPHSRQDTWSTIESLRKGGAAVLLGTQSLDDVERLCDRVALLCDGRILVTGTPGAVGDEIRADPMLRAAFRTRL